jgi:glutaminase
VNIRSFLNLFYSQGILTDDPRISNLRSKIDMLEQEVVDKAVFFDIIHDDASKIEILLFHDKIIPDFERFKKTVQNIFQECKISADGKLPDYIPELAKVNPDNFGVSVCTIDG